LQPLYQPCRAQCSGGLFAAGQKRGGAGGRAYQGNLLRLTGDFDRQGLLLVLCFPAYGISFTANISGKKPAIASR
jgi:hypothetical protein